jgi:hypothetical protein
MSTHAAPGSAPVVEDDLNALTTHLSPALLPARRDDLLAALFRQHAPSSALWEVSRLPPSRVFTTTSEVLEALTTTQPSMVEPWWP